MANQQLSETFLERLKKRENSAFDELVDCYAGRCYGYFYRLCGNAEQSEEFVSELFVKLVEKIDTFDGGSFDKWLFTVASNLFRDHLRRQYRYKRLLDEAADYQRSQIDESADQSSHEAISDRLQWALEKLDTDTAELLMLRYYSQVSFKDLAEMRNEPIGTTLSKVHRGLKKLRFLLEDFR
ncbi:MAG: sigma-70 family RNA polymerase sigma factor [Planctomycetes bacterium]|jgi:RNA polymerase sigma-70 factor (ECF subfamily)|nr:sigma-70 family RNA polymerase sigma factor [Planctomycetota bacterium]